MLINAVSARGMKDRPGKKINCSRRRLWQTIRQEYLNAPSAVIGGMLRMGLTDRKHVHHVRAQTFIAFRRTGVSGVDGWGPADAVVIKQVFIAREGEEK
jgi:hypothetical protein